MNPSEKRDQLNKKINILKDKIMNVDFMKRLKLKDEILELEQEVRKIEIQNQSGDCEICCN